MSGSIEAVTQAETSLAGLMQQHAAGVDLSGKTAVCIITGHGLKDPDTALEIEADRVESSAETDAVERALGWGLSGWGVGFTEGRC